MGGLLAMLLGLVLLGVLYDTVRLIGPGESRCPPPARLRGRRAGPEAAERWLVGRRLHGRIDAATYTRRMAVLAHGHRTFSTRTKTPRTTSTRRT
ncbi:hypothetical protein [Streptomyces niger]|uniref:hypothetical protein n=1 Tax=Streptomyces niger TaxID=66373 RepID=UPI00069BD676|nr:hypothetical protein [Streptomyces niger]